jgi:uncharacterized DUF497 family protein
MSQWNETKRLANLIKHQLDFIDAEVLFDGRPLVTEEARSDDEQRFKSTGSMDGVLRTLIWTWRDNERRYISFRSARDEEKRRYRQLYQ